ncbi:hypothetical protein ANCDUO_01899 [Ancylostoma duodenale]|uniref:Uncharacterized protein n=1 Tax=Ancylostoma duodenale TaxID=51022 RepID=A0A0C2HDX8_9BILA|nr:hypothetical protein ANCDUO_01899 [Ancylostoma duodenale]
MVVTADYLPCQLQPCPPPPLPPPPTTTPKPTPKPPATIPGKVVVVPPNYYLPCQLQPCPPPPLITTPSPAQKPSAAVPGTTGANPKQDWKLTICDTWGVPSGLTPYVLCSFPHVSFQVRKVLASSNRSVCYE